MRGMAREIRVGDLRIAIRILTVAGSEELPTVSTATYVKLSFPVLFS